METLFTYDHPVEGKFFLGRNQDVQTIRDLLSSGKNIVLADAPKAGISSVLNQALDGLTIGGQKPVILQESLLSVREIGCFSEPFAIRLSQALTSGRVIVVFNHFQNILLTEDAAASLKIIEKAIVNTQKQYPGVCTWIFTGNQINAMKSIFDEPGFFRDNCTPVNLSPISQKEIEDYVVRIFLTQGKVIDRALVKDICTKLKNNVWYIQHFASICDSLSRGFIPANIVSKSLETLISIHEPRFIAITSDVTTFQLSLIKAILDGESHFSSAEVIDKYRLNSSANVRRLKDALCKKEIITFNRAGVPSIIDPLFEYWLRNVYLA